MAQVNGRDGLFVSDPRFDRLIIWTLSALAVALMSLVVWTFKDLKSELKTELSALSGNVQRLTTQVAVLETTATEIRALRGYFEDQQGIDRTAMENLRLRVRELELIAAETGRRPGSLPAPPARNQKE